jgi:Protein of unknown function (DUF2281)
MDIFLLLCSLNRALKMSTMAFYSKIEGLPDHLKQQVLDYIEFLLSREANKKMPQTVEKDDQNEIKQPKSRFSGRISGETASQLQQQLKEMRAEWR